MKRTLVFFGLLICGMAGAWADQYSQAGFYMVRDGQTLPYNELGISKAKPLPKYPMPVHPLPIEKEIEPLIIEEPVYHQTFIKAQKRPETTIETKFVTRKKSGVEATVPIIIIFPEKINSGHARAGDVLKLKMGSPVISREGHTIIQENAEVFATVKTTRSGGIFSRPGKINVSLDYAKGESGEKIPLSGTLSRHGGGNQALTLTGAILIAWPLFFLQGSNAVIEAGTNFPASVAASTPLQGPAFRLEAE